MASASHEQDARGLELGLELDVQLTKLLASFHCGQLQLCIPCLLVGLNNGLAHPCLVSCQCLVESYKCGNFCARAREARGR